MLHGQIDRSCWATRHHGTVTVVEERGMRARVRRSCRPYDDRVREVTWRRLNVALDACIAVVGAVFGVVFVSRGDSSLAVVLFLLAVVSLVRLVLWLVRGSADLRGRPSPSDP
jgi:hypothetical protein